MKEQENYKSLLDSLHGILQESNDRPFEAEDKNLNNAVASQNQEQDIEYDRRNKLYTELLNTYIKIYNGKEKAKSIYKAIFFTVTMFLFFGIISICLYSMYMLSKHGNGSLANIGVAISNVAGIVSTLIILPKIIAEHLFPVNEESNMIDMVRNMQDNDANIRDFIYKSHDEQDNLNA